MDDARLLSADLAEARRLLRAAARLVVLTGAGISTDSGLADFRGPNGLWTRNPDAEKASQLANYVADPALRRRIWASRVEARDVRYEPNEGHRAVVRLERWGTLDTLVTQNVDGLHLVAGSDPARVVEIHGTVREVACLSCGDRSPTAVIVDRVAAGEEDPTCTRCGGILKSATISFGQSLVEADIERVDAAARRADCVLAVGTTLSVYPVAAMVPMALRHGAAVIIVNGGPTDMDGLATVRLDGQISEILPALVDD